MHTIIADYGRAYFGRAYKEITDAEWDIRTVSARGERHWTYASAWGDHLASNDKMTQDRLGDELRFMRSGPTDASGLFSAGSNEQLMQKEACRSART